MKFRELEESSEKKGASLNDVVRFLKNKNYSPISTDPKRNKITVHVPKGVDRTEVLNDISNLLKTNARFENAEYKNSRALSSVGEVSIEEPKCHVVVKYEGGISEYTWLHETLQMLSAYLDFSDLDELKAGLRDLIPTSFKKISTDIENCRSTIENSGWLDTYIKSGRIIRQVFGANDVNDYICFTTGGMGILTSSCKTRYTNIIKKLLGYLDENKPDNINPCDIVFIRKDQANIVLDTLDDVIESFKTKDADIAYNEWKLTWFKLYDEGLFYPISLKKITGNGRIEYHNKISDTVIDNATINAELKSITMNFDFDLLTSQFIIKRENLDDSNDISDVVFQSRSQGDKKSSYYSNIACNTYINGSEVQLGKIKNVINRLAPELKENVSKRFGSSSSKLSKVEEGMLDEWQYRLDELLALESNTVKVNFKYKDGNDTVEDMYNYAMNYKGKTDEDSETAKGKFAIYMQTIDYFYTALVECKQLKKNLEERLILLLNAAFKINDMYSFYIKIS